MGQKKGGSFICSQWPDDHSAARTSNLGSVFSFSSLNRWTAGLPLQQLRWRNKSCKLQCVWHIVLGPLPRLPPVVIVLRQDMQNVARRERQASFSAQYQVVGRRIIIKQSSYKYLHKYNMPFTITHFSVWGAEHADHITWNNSFQTLTWAITTIERR